MTIQLRPFQQHLSDQIDAAWALGINNVLTVLPTGGGKTVLFSHKIAQEQGASCAIAHRKELVTQISQALARNGVRHRIIGPDEVARTCTRLHMDEQLGNHVDVQSRVAVAGVDTLIRMDANDSWFKSVRLVVQDECFPAGTLVDGRPIESLKVGDIVTAFNEVTGEFEPRSVVRLFKNPTPKHMMRVTAGHHVLNCTKGHPFWTKRGWVEAINLKDSDELLLHELSEEDSGDGRTTTLQIPQDWENLLYEGVRHDISGRTSQIAKEVRCKNSQVLHVQEARIRNKSLEENREGLLQPGVFISVPSAGVVGNDVRDKSEVRQSTDDRTQPDAQRGMPQQGVGHTEADQTRAEGSRWEWSSAFDSRIYGSVAAVGARVLRAIRDRYEASESVSEALQDRLGESDAEDCDRGGRGVAQLNREASAGSSQGGVSSWVRLDSIEVYEYSSTDSTGSGVGDGFVYNIEVEGLHTYVANGIVVHNCHHVTRDNKWGKAFEMFPNARHLGVTATPLRADGKGLGSHADGIFDHMLVGPTVSELTTQGYLCPYRVAAPRTRIDLSNVGITASGDYSHKPLATAMKKSTIVGDVVGSYLKFAKGKRGVTFAVSVEEAGEIAAEYRNAGVPAEAVSAETDPYLRTRYVKQLRNGELLQLVNVDLFGEGFDLPAIEVVSLARPTMSYGLYAQQFGRVLRTMPGKEFGLVIDHVGNVETHGLPDAYREWSLDRRDKRAKADTQSQVQIRVCQSPTCQLVYERIHRACPYCGHVPEIASRSAPEYVDGDLELLDEATLNRMRGLIDAGPKYHPDPIVQATLKKRWNEQQQAQGQLRERMAQWGGERTHQGDTLAQAQRRFYLQYGVDVLTAQTLNAKDALELMERIKS